MIAIGVDYGSTNSYVANFMPNIEGNIPISYLMSAVEYNNESIKSPKRLLHNIDRMTDDEITKIKCCIEKCLKELFRDHKGRFVWNGDRVCITITVPNAFKDCECKILKESVYSSLRTVFNYSEAQLSSVEVLVLPEPVAAALYFAYAMNKVGALQNKQYAIVSDVGGGTTDLAVVKIVSHNRRLAFEVMHTEHMFNLGGNDIDNTLADYFISKRPELGSIERDLLVRACCELKIGFSYVEGLCRSEVAVLDENGCFVMLNNREVVLEMNLDEFQTLLYANGGFLTRYRTLVENLKKEFHSSDNSFVYLLPVGGTSRLSLVRDVLREVFYEYHDNIMTLATEQVRMKNGEGGRYDSVVRGAAIYSAYNAKLIDYNIDIKNRTMHRISLHYGENRLHECVMQCSSDGIYECICRCEPTYFNQDAGTFEIRTIKFYQGGNSDFVDNDSEVLCELRIPQLLYTHGRRLQDIHIVVKLDIRGGRLHSVIVCAEGCREDGSDYVEKIDCLC